MPTRTGSATWRGSLPDGSGSLEVGSGAFTSAYSFSSRFADGKGTNPEELIGAAHAACFSMAFSNGLAQAGHTPTSVQTTASVHLVKDDAGFSIGQIDLNTVGVVPGISTEEFAAEATKAKANCPVSRALTGVKIKLEAKLAS